MEIAKLKYFHAVARLNHVTKAAEEMCISQPSLTQAIRSLESELGVKLLQKEGRNCFLLLPKNDPHGIIKEVNFIFDF